MKTEILLCDVCQKQISGKGWSMTETDEETDAAGRRTLSLYPLTPEAPIHLCGQTCVQRRVADFTQRPEKS